MPITQFQNNQEAIQARELTTYPSAVRAHISKTIPHILVLCLPWHSENSFYEIKMDIVCQCQVIRVAVLGSSRRRNQDGYCLSKSGN